MKIKPSAVCLSLAVLSVVPCFSACSDNAPVAMEQAGAGSTPAGTSAGSGGAPASGGSNAAQAGGGSGPLPSQGGAGTNAGGSSAGGSGGQAGSGGAAGTSQGGTAGAAMGGRGGGGSGGSSGAAGSGGSGGSGGAASPGAELNGFSWTMKCNKADTSAGAENRCYLLPMDGAGACGSGYTSIDQTLHFGGTPGTMYKVALHIQGSQEAGDYTGGTALVKQFLQDATHNSGLHNFLSMDVSSPKHTYFPNAGAGGGTVTTYDYKVTITIEGGASIHMKAFDSDCLQHRFCPDTTYTNCGYVLPPFTTANMRIDGNFLFVTVDSATPM